MLCNCNLRPITNFDIFLLLLFFGVFCKKKKIYRHISALFLSPRLGIPKTKMQQHIGFHFENSSIQFLKLQFGCRVALPRDVTGLSAVCDYCFS